ncbi:PREDICTED: dehydrogenase/reductase SDR family member 7 [Dufourea novaeangliae]|uniref:dehydrogenase/reductase SDR family member 7 n=1 Tax=Dufourea novaeangliae TaxID=178035 RepID=UPI0007675024|nr:PREDICTED: dehydrogenase/reductase SDR family member 7 [Dufourea novaeangliae]XP_015437743.1 PREDICTED: dehydrogenase/reductase SDR family member 7 [Dufourea novaeangliae]XP_015437744.1 PREDICTED: dehydrogenase/reductase SDR family member 7 [Dufourea novaeangliae]XP_015437745.1 PREDICTED: dehydrogenase/reductase SDR family member 7 [Dufourea novaeangliae]XP_015437746.1 PREDICTED: dehydrogenase/reductase SDR family member 7 [Dufourea novaeangliae]
MDLLALVGLVVIIYYLVYMIYPWFLDCDLKLAFYEKFGKPITSLRGKTIWITGASSGIGEHLAYVLATAGCKLVLSARRKEELEKVKANCLQRNSSLTYTDIEVLVLDICDIDSHETAFKHVISKFGKLDILVNNAGRSQRALWEQIDLAVDKQMFDLNVFSQVALSRLVGKYFFQVGEGHFVVTSSAAGVGATAFSATYCATKYALHGYFHTFWIEKISQNVPVTVVCPGPIQTNFLAEAYTEKPGEKYGENTNSNSENKVSAERCATLMGVAIANKLLEVWISKPLILQLLYLRVYYPNIAIWVLRILGPRFLQRLRDDKTTLKQEQ